MSREGNYSLLKATTAFEPVSPDFINGTCGNIQSSFDPKFEFSDSTKGSQQSDGLFGDKYFFEIVSAPMLLARLCAGFEGLQIQVDGQSGYKITWNVVLKHKESGNLITFYDWKGGPSFGSNVRVAEGLFKEDVAQLLQALVNENFPHPYDGCSVGEIA